MPIESVMPSSHLILCRPLLLLPPIPPSIRVFSNESTVCMRWPKYWCFSISPSNEHPGLISFKMDWLDLLVVQGTLKSLLQHHSSKASIFWCSAFLTVQPTPIFLGFPCGSADKESACNVRDLGSIPGLGRSPGEGIGYPLQCSGLENPMDCMYSPWGPKDLDTTEQISLSLQSRLQTKEPTETTQIICLVFGLTVDVAPNILAPWTTVLDKRLIYSVCIHFSSTATSKHSLINSPLVNGFPSLTNKWATQKTLQPHFHILFLWRNFAVMKYHLKFSCVFKLSFPVSWK